MRLVRLVFSLVVMFILFTPLPVWGQALREIGTDPFDVALWWNIATNYTLLDPKTPEGLSEEAFRKAFEAPKPKFPSPANYKDWAPANYTDSAPGAGLSGMPVDPGAQRVVIQYFISNPGAR